MRIFEIPLPENDSRGKSLLNCHEDILEKAWSQSSVGDGPKACGAVGVRRARHRDGKRGLD